MDNKKSNKIEDILISLDRVKRAPAPDFFYTRLIARMEKRIESGKKKPFLLRPAFALSAAVVVLVMNAALLFGRQEQEETNPLADTEKYQSIASEYSLNENILYDISPEK
jgi:hypothetical protein